MKKFRGILFALFFGMAGALCAGEPGTTGAVELKIPVGPRAIAMGEAFSAVADDANAIYWNPAGLRQLGGVHLTAQHTEFIDTVAYQYIAGATPLGAARKAAAGVAVKMLSTGEEKVIDENGVETGETFSASYMDINLAGAYRLNYYVDIGLTGKYITKKLFNASASTFAADLGVLWRPTTKFSFAGVLQNLGPGLKFAEESDRLPFAARLGSAVHLFEDQFTVDFDVAFPNDNKPVASLGGEYWYQNTLVGRFGYRYQGALDLNDLGVGGKAGLFLGAGLKFAALGNFVGLDYAWSTAGFLGTVHRFALNVYLK